MDGRLTSDSRADISSIGYNELGQIMTAQDLTGTVKYLYLANGDKYAVIRDGCGRVYMGDMVLNFCNLHL